MKPKCAVLQLGNCNTGRLICAHVPAEYHAPLDTSWAARGHLPLASGCPVHFLIQTKQGASPTAVLRNAAVLASAASMRSGLVCAVYRRP